MTAGATADGVCRCSDGASDPRGDASRCVGAKTWPGRGHVGRERGRESVVGLIGVLGFGNQGDGAEDELR